MIRLHKRQGEGIYIRSQNIISLEPCYDKPAHTTIEKSTGDTINVTETMSEIIVMIEELEGF